jgi:hypothetical protein
MTNTTNAANSEQWTQTGGFAMKMSAMLTVLALVAIVVGHSPQGIDVADSAPAATAQSSNAPFEYFPSQYELNAPEPGEPAPTF